MSDRPSKDVFRSTDGSASIAIDDEDYAITDMNVSIDTSLSNTTTETEPLELGQQEYEFSMELDLSELPYGGQWRTVVCPNCNEACRVPMDLLTIRLFDRDKCTTCGFPLGGTER
jgi:hypothetical protein